MCARVCGKSDWESSRLNGGRLGRRFGRGGGDDGGQEDALAKIAKTFRAEAFPGELGEQRPQFGRQFLILDTFLVSLARRVPVSLPPR